MRKSIRFLNTLLLSAALLAPLAPLALQAQDRDHDRDNQRVYDRAHKQYHTWNNDEDQAYRQWYGQTYHGRQYRDYRKLNKKQQEAYWNWRNNNNHDRDRDHDRDRH